MRKNYWRNLFLLMLGGVGLGIALAVGFFSRQSALNYLHPARLPRLPGDEPSRLGVTYQDVTLTTTDGITLSAWYTPPQNGAVILVAHGYANIRQTRVYALLAQAGYGVLAWDARGHGTSGGALCTWGYYEARDVDAALDFALQQAGVTQVGALGQSMGGATVLKAAAQRPEIAAVVADSVFPALEEMVDRAIPLPWLRPVIRFFMEQETGLTAAAVQPVVDIAQLSPRPVLIIQGVDDHFIPSDSAERLYAAAGEPRALWRVPNTDHIMAVDVAAEEYAQRVVAFFATALLEAPAAP